MCNCRFCSFGGIIPPVARDLHEQNIDDVVTRTLQQAQVGLEDLDAIAVTTRPGLSLSLLVGMNYAKELSRRSSKPLIPIHHMEAHALTARITNKVCICIHCNARVVLYLIFLYTVLLLLLLEFTVTVSSLTFVWWTLFVGRRKEHQ